MADPGSLFSLEVVVETVENVVVSCRAPAIAFRLLDFPTLVIRAEENRRPRDSTIPGYHKLHSGKSCLFKINKNMLYTRLQSTPLYVMLVDIGAENTKLLASTTISLSNCFENVWQSVERNGLDVPAVDGNKGVFELHNLMGTPVAIVRLSYRIYSLGGTINGHVNTSETQIKSNYCKPLENNTRREKEVSKQNQKSTIDENLLPQISLQKTENTLSDFQCEVGTQADFSNKERPMKSFNMQSRPPKFTNDKATVNITKPPPLYYNSQSSSMNSFSPMNSKSLGFTQERGLVEKTNDAVNGKEAIPREYYRTISVQTTNEAEVPNDSSKLYDERAELSGLPVINALLNELSLAKRNWMGGAQLEQHRNEAQPVAVNHKDVPIFQPDTKPCALKNKLNPSSKRKVLPKKCVKLSGKGVLVSRNPMKIKKSLLKCGTTKTQKLRENLNKKMAVGSSNCRHINVEEKRAPTQNSGNQGNLVATQDKETKEVACQVEMTSSGAHENKQEIEFRHVGIQCISPKGKKEKLSFSDEDNRKMFAGNSKDIQEDQKKELALTVPESQQEICLPIEVELTSHSKSSTSQELMSIKETYSNFVPPITKNSRYNKDKHSSISEEGKSFSIDSESSKKNGLLGETYSHTKCPSKSASSSFEHSYSHDNFDSYVSDPIPESNASDKSNIGISTVETNEQSD